MNEHILLIVISAIVMFNAVRGTLKGLLTDKTSDTTTADRAYHFLTSVMSLSMGWFLASHIGWFISSIVLITGSAIGLIFIVLRQLSDRLEVADKEEISIFYRVVVLFIYWVLIYYSEFWKPLLAIFQ